MKINRDCRHFRGDIPCRYHKDTGLHCEECPEYEQRAGRILIIKLGAAGDVIRTTPILRRLALEYPNHDITWVSHYPKLLPSMVHDPRELTLETLLWLRNIKIDLLLNLDKDAEACALAAEVPAAEKRGFTLDEDGYCLPLDNGPAHAKYLTGLFDDINMACEESYLDEIFAIAGYEFRGEEYILDKPNGVLQVEFPKGGAIIGLNTGCGSRWPSRLWPEPHWAELSNDLLSMGYEVVLLGGPDEDAKNRRLSEETGAQYVGVLPLEDFILLVDECELVVTAVTMAMHIAIGLQKKLVLFNNIFNPNEFELYNRGVILSPPKECRCFFQPECTEDLPCMETLKPSSVIEAIEDVRSAK